MVAPYAAGVAAVLPGAKALNETLKRLFREGEFAALLILDIDDLAALNRRSERGVGDSVLDTVSASLKRTKALCFRVAGDDFVVVYTGSRRISPEGLAVRAELLRETLALRTFAKTGVRITLTVGGLAHPGADLGNDERMADLVTTTADALVIRAKRAGKDRVLILPASSRAPTGVLGVMVEFYRELARINRSVADHHRNESRIDSLTGLHNRKAFDETLDRVFKAHQRSGHPFAVLTLDTDSLKEINDRRGHDAGDRFLLDVTRVLRETVRVSDLCSRWGGDEFAIVADRLTPRTARKLAERIRKTVQDRTDGTVSLGVYCGSPSSPAAALKAADEALYRAKEGGKNRVVVAQSPRT